MQHEKHKKKKEKLQNFRCGVAAAKPDWKKSSEPIGANLNKSISIKYKFFVKTIFTLLLYTVIEVRQIVHGVVHILSSGLRLHEILK